MGDKSAVVARLKENLRVHKEKFVLWLHVSSDV
jgi:hypothetical protein